MPALGLMVVLPALAGTSSRSKQPCDGISNDAITGLIIADWGAEASARCSESDIQSICRHRSHCRGLTLKAGLAIVNPKLNHSSMRQVTCDDDNYFNA